ncbi:AAA family ATPase [Microbispora hainanensis]|uniref:PQQ-binding-like beta-propeller repeat protein n=1 Tax=Microbispora hainanensis TaxID=568844 RepID=A0A544YTA4_9ACTN|nr:AAA family ATPase [Microbispora hainanensis]TQS19752.1 PQQ-binding-like beta-propeller repeat protein [Microbispora hainanensis]
MSALRLPGDSPDGRFDRFDRDLLAVLALLPEWTRDLARRVLPSLPLLATASHDGTVRVWGAATGAELRRLNERAYAVRSVEAIPSDDGILLASAGDNRMVRIWNAATGEELRRLDGRTRAVWRLCSFPLDDRTLLATASFNESVRLWDPTTGEELRRLKGDTRTVRGLCSFPLDGRTLLATASADATVRLWDPATGEELHRLGSHIGPVWQVGSFSLGGRTLLATAGDDGHVRIWNPVSGEQLSHHSSHRGPARDVCAVPLGPRTLLASGGDDGRILIWDPDTGIVVQEKRHTHGGVYGVCVLPLGGRTLVAWSSSNGTVGVVDPLTGEEVQRMESHGGTAWAVCAFPRPGTAPLGELEDAGVIEQQQALGTFWVRDRVRAELAEHLRGFPVDPEIIAPFVTNPLWLSVTRTHRHDQSGMSLVKAVDERASEGDFAATAQLIACAEAVGTVAAGSLAGAARRARWRVDLFYRQQDDAHHLQHYVRRPLIEKEIAALFNDDVHWTLHLLGMGGVGKTMVIRYLASGRFAADRGLLAPLVARVDFDHLDPRYPEDRPAELLLALGQELLPYLATRDDEALYREFVDAADRLHEECARERSDAALVEELLAQTVEAFAAALRNPKRPILLVLDTCEELAKLYLPGASAPALRRTFQILSSLHAAAPALRVVLAGRRWLVEPPTPNLATGGPLLEARPFVRVVEVGGFTPAEAEDYLKVRRVPARWAEVLLARSRQGNRHNPFDLAAYASWVLTDPSLEPSALERLGRDPYVEQRIIGRLPSTGLKAVLGVAAELGRFDRELGELTMGGPAFDQLAAQEWVRVVSWTPEGRPRVVEIDENLLPRLHVAMAGRYPVDREKIGRTAATLLVQANLIDLPVETVEIAVRLLPVEEAADLWAVLESRIVAEGAWGWASQVAPRALAAEALRAHEEDATIRAAILATQAAAHLHLGQRTDLLRLWQAVGNSATRHPSPEQRLVLAARAALGRITAGSTEESPDQVLDRFGDAAPPDAILAADEAWLLARDEVGRRPPGDPVQNSLQVIRYILAGKYQAAAEYDLAPEGSATYSRGCRDWLPPRDLDANVWTVRLFAAWMAGKVWTDEEAIHEKISGVLPRLGDIDAERMASVGLRLLLAQGMVDVRLLTIVEQSERYVPGRWPIRWIHHRIRPLIVQLAECWDVLGQPERAADLLRDRIEAAVQTADDPDTVDECQLMLLRLCRRNRTTELFPSIRRVALSGSPRVRAEAWLVLTLVEGARPAKVQDAGSFHGFYQCADPNESLPHHALPEAEPGIAPAESAADISEMLGRPPRFKGFVCDPELMLRLGRPMSFADGERGRAFLYVGESLAMRDPHQGSLLLRQAARLLRAGQCAPYAEQAGILSSLAVIRAGGQAYVDSHGPLRPPWQDRRRAIEEYPFPTVQSSSPELHLRGALPIRTGTATLATSWAHEPIVVVPPGRELDEARLREAIRGEPRARLVAVQVSHDQDLAPWEQWAGLAAQDRRRLVAFRWQPGGPWPHGSFEGIHYYGPEQLARTERGLDGRLLPDSCCVGTPVRTAAGWHIRIADRDGGSSSSRQNLLRPAPADRTGVFFLMADPVDGPPRPLGKLRTGFVALAREIVDVNDATAILIVPPLPDETAAQVVQIMLTLRAPIVPLQIINLTREVKRLIAQHEHDDGEDLPSRDVILYLRLPEETSL